MEKVTISVIIPIYNSEKKLYRCINSIIKQSVKDIEIILIDDGSTDESLNICNKIADEDSRIKVFSQKNSGVSVARNKGIDLAKGKYIMFCDSDDFVEENWCYELINLICENENIFAICGMSIINTRSEEKVISQELFSKEFGISKLSKKNFFDIYNKKLLNSPCNKIYSKNIIDQNNIRFDKNLTLGEDLLFNLEYMRYIDKIEIVNKSLYNYIRTNEESLDNKYYENLFDIYKYLHDELYKYLEEFEADLEKYEINFYTSYLYGLIKVLKNTFNKKNNIRFFNKIKYNSHILKSNEFKLCLQKSDINKIYDYKYINVLKTGNYMLVYIFEKLYFIKEKIRNKIKSN